MAGFDVHALHPKERKKYTESKCESGEWRNGSMPIPQTDRLHTIKEMPDITCRKAGWYMLNALELTDPKKTCLFSPSFATLIW